MNGKCSRESRSDLVVDRISEPLLAAQISLRGLNAYMSEQELDLLKLSACLVAQSGTGTAEIVRRNAIQTTFRGPRLYYAPDNFRAETTCRDPAGLVDRPKNRPVEMPAAVNQLSTASLTQVGTGTVRT